MCVEHNSQEPTTSRYINLVNVEPNVQSGNPSIDVNQNATGDDEENTSEVRGPAEYLFHRLNDGDEFYNCYDLEEDDEDYYAYSRKRSDFEDDLADLTPEMSPIVDLCDEIDEIDEEYGYAGVFSLLICVLCRKLFYFKGADIHPELDGSPLCKRCSTALSFVDNSEAFIRNLKRLNIDDLFLKFDKGGDNVLFSYICSTDSSFFELFSLTKPVVLRGFPKDETPTLQSYLFRVLNRRLSKVELGISFGVADSAAENVATDAGFPVFKAIPGLFKCFVSAFMGKRTDPDKTTDSFTNYVEFKNKRYSLDSEQLEALRLILNKKRCNSAMSDLDFKSVNLAFNAFANGKVILRDESGEDCQEFNDRFVALARLFHNLNVMCLGTIEDDYTIIREILSAAIDFKGKFFESITTNLTLFQDIKLRMPKLRFKDIMSVFVSLTATA